MKTSLHRVLLIGFVLLCPGRVFADGSNDPISSAAFAAVNEAKNRFVIPLAEVRKRFQILEETRGANRFEVRAKILDLNDEALFVFEAEENQRLPVRIQTKGIGTQGVFMMLRALGVVERYIEHSGGVGNGRLVDFREGKPWLMWTIRDGAILGDCREWDEKGRVLNKWKVTTPQYIQFKGPPGTNPGDN